MNDFHRVHIVYSGNVQGVGFRFTAERIGSKLSVKGFVKNQPNGTVEVVAEGEKELLKEFIMEIDENMSGYISDSKVSWLEPESNFTSFDIRF